MGLTSDISSDGFPFPFYQESRSQRTFTSGKNVIKINGKVMDFTS